MTGRNRNWISAVVRRLLGASSAASDASAGQPPIELPEAFQELPLSGETLFKLIRDFEFRSVLDVGSGAGLHKGILESYGKDVTAVDLGRSVHFTNPEDAADYGRVHGDFMTYSFERKFDCVWASHVLEHQPNSGLFIDRCLELLEDDGVLAITVPPLKHEIVGGHLTLWNAGLLLYQLVFAGLDCSDAAVRSYGYNVSVIVRNRRRPDIELSYGGGDIDTLGPFLPSVCHEGFDGRIERWNW